MVGWALGACSGSADPLEDAALPTQGTLGGACFANQTCFAGLVCSNSVCVNSSLDSGVTTDAADASAEDLGGANDADPSDSGGNTGDVPSPDGAEDGSVVTDGAVDGGPDGSLDGGMDGSADGGVDLGLDAGGGGAPPSPPAVRIQPEHPTNSDDLLCVVEAPSVDPEGQPVTYRFAWTRNGASTNETGQTVLASATGDNEQWTCTVTPNDGAQDGPSDSASVIVGFDGLQAYYRLDDGAGGTVTDSGRFGRNGTVLNLGPTSGWITGRVGGGLAFDGIDDFAQLPPIDLSRAFTLSVWVRAPMASSTYCPLLYRPAGPGPSDGVEFVLSPGVLFMMTPNSQVSAGVGGCPSGGTWFHVAASCDGQGSLKLYRSGQLFWVNDPLTAPLVPTRLTGNQPIYLGTQVEGGVTRRFLGDLDEVRIYDRELSAQEVADLAFGSGLMRPVPAGTFSMGSPSNEVGRGLDETQHDVTLTHNLLVGVNELTQLEYFALNNNDNPTLGVPCNECAADGATWHQAANTANQVSSRAGLPLCYSCIGSGDSIQCTVAIPPAQCTGYRLPTEAEWEYFARAGASSAFNNGAELVAGTETTCDQLVNLSDGTSLPQLAWYCYNGGGVSHPPASFPPNAWGLYDLHGNLAEWTQDWYGGDHPVGAQVDPIGAAAGTERVTKGGSQLDPPRSLRAAARRPAVPGAQEARYGFRLVRTMP